MTGHGLPLVRHLVTLLAAALFGSLAGAEETRPASPAAELFLKHCAVCHGKDGSAQTPTARILEVKNLSLSRLTDAQVIEQISEGRLQGQKASKMPAFKEKLNRQEIESLVPVVTGFRKEPIKANSGQPPEKEKRKK